MTTTTTNITPQNIAGFWGWKSSNELEYIQSGVAGAFITTDDGIQRWAFPFSLQSGRTLYNRPQEEWETPTLVGTGYAFSPDGKFEKLITLESGEMPKGYLKQTLHQVGTYTIDGDIVTIQYTYNVATFYSDLENSLRSEILPLETAYLRLSLGDGTTLSTITELVRQPDGSLVPNPGNPRANEMERNPNYQPIDLTRGLIQDGTLRADAMYGTSLIDQLNGGNGNDVIFSSGGSDRLTGGNGSDRFVIDTPDASSADTITDFNPAEDILIVKTPEFSGLTPNAFIDRSQFEIGDRATSAQTRFFYNRGSGGLFFDADGSGGGTAVRITNLGADLNLNYTNFYAYQSGNNQLGTIAKPTPNNDDNGGGGNNGGGGDNGGGNLPDNDPLTGGAGNDVLIGTNGNDLMRGRDGNDRLNGGNGSDQMWGGAGSDVITGGASRDFFVLERGAGVDRITDFQNGVDKLGLAGMRLGQIDVVQRGRNTLIRIDNDSLAVLVGVKANQINAADFTRMTAS